MTNKLASFSLSASYSDSDDQQTAISRVNTSVPYTAQAHTEIDIPDTTASSTVYAVSFGSIGTEATGVVIKNETANGDNPGQDLILKINGSAALQHIPPGGCVALFNPKAAGGSPITAVSLTTTATQTGPGRISAHVFGDPV